MSDMALAEGSRPAIDWTGASERSAAGALLSADVLTGAGAHNALQAEWQYLAGRQRGPVFFQSPALLAIWSRYFGKDGKDPLVTVVVRQDGDPIMIWPMQISRRGPVRIAQGAGAPIGQYDELLFDPACDPRQALNTALDALGRTLRPDVLMLERVRHDGALFSALGDAAPLGPAEGAPFSDLSGGMQDFMASLKTRVTRQQNKRVRRFEQEGQVGFAVAQNPEDAQAWLAEAMALKREWLRSTGRLSRAFLKPETSECLADLARSLTGAEAEPRMVVSRLSVDGRTAAIEMGFCHRGAYHLYLGAFEPDFGKLGPGNVLTEKVLEWCVENGISRYDMMTPRYRNKSEWQSDEVLASDFALPLTLAGRLYVNVVLNRVEPALRRAFYALPDSVRSGIAGRTLRM